MGWPFRLPELAEKERCTSQGSPAGYSAYPVVDTSTRQLHQSLGSMLLCQDVPGLQWEHKLLTLMQAPASANLQGGVLIWSCVTAQKSHPLFWCNAASPARARSVIRVYGTGLSLLISHQTAESAYITPTSLHSQQRYLCLQRLIHPINTVI